MRNRGLPRSRTARAVVALAAALVALTGAAGCSGDGDEAGDAPTGDAGGRSGDADSQGDTCTLLDDDALAPLFPDGVPEPSGTSMGEGFAECEWGRESEGPVVLLSTLPADDFRRDYVEQLDVTSPVPGIGDSAVSFPGFVGIGRGSAGGGSVGFAQGDEAVLVAVRSSGRPAEDAGLASELAAVVAGQL